VPRVSLCCIESDAITQSEHDVTLSAEVSPLLEFLLRTNFSTSPEINSPPSSSDHSFDTSPDGSAEPPEVPEVRPFIPDGSFPYCWISQTTFNVADPLLTHDCSHQFLLRNNFSTSPEINSPPSSSDHSLDTSSDGSAEPPEVRPFIPDVRSLTVRFHR
jgi:hypothetical protein